MKRAYRTTWSVITFIVAAESVAQARRRALIGVQDAGHDPVWIDIRVRRAPEYDGWAAVDKTGHCWAEEQLTGCRDS